MRNLMILMVLVSTMAFNACGQKDNVPQKVKTAFAQKFPDAKKVKWDKENAREWEAEFMLNEKEYSANFDMEGNWKETEHEIKRNEIPAAVKATLENNFADYKIEEAEISETADGMVYEFEIEKGESSMEVRISPDGKLLNKEIEEEGEDRD